MNDDTPLYKLNKYAIAVALAVNSVAVSAPCTDHKYVTMEIISRFSAVESGPTNYRMVRRGN